MLDYLYTKDYSNPYSEDEEDSLLFHVVVYALGEIYAISGLKRLARTRFWKAGHLIKKSHILASAIQAIYGSTPESDKGLRDVVVMIAEKQIEDHMKNHEFREMMDGLGQFREDLVASAFRRYTYAFLFDGSQLTYEPSCEPVLKVLIQYNIKIPA